MTIVIVMKTSSMLPGRCFFTSEEPVPSTSVLLGRLHIYITESTIQSFVSVLRMRHTQDLLVLCM